MKVSQTEIFFFSKIELTIFVSMIMISEFSKFVKKKRNKSLQDPCHLKDEITQLKKTEAVYVCVVILPPLIQDVLLFTEK